MDKESLSPASLFRELGRTWSKNRDDKQAIADLHAATEAFKTLLEGEKALVHRCSLTLNYIEKEVEHVEGLDFADRTETMHPWINPHKLLLARQRCCLRSIALCKQGRMFVAAWRDHFGHIVPEMAHRFPHTHEMEIFFTHVEQVFAKKQEEYEAGRSFTQNAPLELGREQLEHIERTFQEILNRLHTIQHDVAVLEHDRKNRPLQELIFEELQKLAPLLFVTHGEINRLA